MKSIIIATVLLIAPLAGAQPVDFALCTGTATVYAIDSSNHRAERPGPVSVKVQFDSGIHGTVTLNISGQSGDDIVYTGDIYLDGSKTELVPNPRWGDHALIQLQQLANDQMNLSMTVVDDSSGKTVGGVEPATLNCTQSK